MSEIQLGVKAKCKVTGLTGILIGKATWLTGCDQWCIKPVINKDGETVEGEWVDEGCIKVIGKGLTKKEVSAKEPGGPRRDAPRA